MFFGQNIFGQSVSTSDVQISQPVAPVRDLNAVGGRLPITSEGSRRIPIVAHSDRTMTGGLIPVTGRMPVRYPVSMTEPWKVPIAQARHRTMTGGTISVRPERVAFAGFGFVPGPFYGSTSFPFFPQTRAGLIRAGILPGRGRAMFPVRRYGFGPPTMSGYGAYGNSPDGLGGLIGIGG